MYILLNSIENFVWLSSLRKTRTRGSLTTKLTDTLKPRERPFKTKLIINVKILKPKLTWNFQWIEKSPVWMRGERQWEGTLEKPTGTRLCLPRDPWRTYFFLFTEEIHWNFIQVQFRFLKIYAANSVDNECKKIGVEAGRPIKRLLQ